MEPVVVQTVTYVQGVNVVRNMDTAVQAHHTVDQVAVQLSVLVSPLEAAMAAAKSAPMVYVADLMAHAQAVNAAPSTAIVVRHQHTVEKDVKVDLELALEF